MTPSTFHTGTSTGCPPVMVSAANFSAAVCRRFLWTWPPHLQTLTATLLGIALQQANHTWKNPIPKIFLASNCLSWRFLALVRFWYKKTPRSFRLKSSSLGHFVFHVAVRHLCLRNTREETMQICWKTQGDDCDHGLAGWKILETRLLNGFCGWFDASVSTTEAFTRVARTWQVLVCVQSKVVCMFRRSGYLMNSWQFEDVFLLKISTCTLHHNWKSQYARVALAKT